MAGCRTRMGRLFAIGILRAKQQWSKMIGLRGGHYQGPCDKKKRSYATITWTQMDKVFKLSSSSGIIVLGHSILSLDSAIVSLILLTLSSRQGKFDYYYIIEI